MIVGIPPGGAVYVKFNLHQKGALSRETNSQVAPLCAILEDPETPVLTEVGDLIFRVVIRTKTVFHGQTRVPQTELVDNVLHVRIDTMIV
jgi:hypothetical protein